MGTQKVKIYGQEEEDKEKKVKRPKKTEEIKKAEEIKEAKPKKKFLKSKVKGPRTRGKKWQEKSALIDKSKDYSLKEAIELAKKTSFSSFDGSLELHLRVAPKKGQTVRGMISLPFGTGKGKKVAVFSPDILGKIEKGKIDFDILLAEPSDMPKLAKVAKILGPRGLMPNPKSGTILEKPKEAILKFEKGLIEYKADPNNIVHQIVGKVSWENEKLLKNIETLINEFRKYEPKSAFICASMGPSVKIKLD